ncbi:4Fe-4S binding protein [uncultured Bacteroides sp.]|uniref:4Fe-4S binding protein n=1 Tax=uncultured Bacteroides sp. TaxID=162156 RepID=UPI002AA6A71F|nr:4Fe-4S binding protein [uncultured Bacteroides sp.]
MIHLLYFSPTHTSAKIAHAMAKGMDMPIGSEWDITYEVPKEVTTIDNGLVIIAVPVYGGRVAETAMERLRSFKGTQTPVIAVALYGNRDYEDALKELCDTVSQQGFIPIAGGAFIGEHSYSSPEMPIAEGRPDEKDLAVARQLGQEAFKKWQQLSKFDVPTLSVKGNFPYKEKGKHTPQAPSTDGALCIQCGYCIDVCPTGAISLTEDEGTFNDPALCIKCCACVKECPEHARSFETPFRAYLHENFQARREPELFV